MPENLLGFQSAGCGNKSEAVQIWLPTKGHNDLNLGVRDVANTQPLRESPGYQRYAAYPRVSDEALFPSEDRS